MASVLTWAPLSLAKGAEDPVIALHLKSAANESCGQVERLPCNKEQGSLTVHGNLKTRYTIYVLAMNVSKLDGIAGAAFGITYGPNLKVSDWQLCGDFETPGGPAGVVWPQSGSGNLIRWNSKTHCQRIAAPADTGGDVTAVLGALSVYAYDSDVLQITERSYLPKPDFEITTCKGEVIDLMLPETGSARLGGRVGFGSTFGRDPCKNSYYPAERFKELTDSDLSNTQVKFSWLGGTLHFAPSLVLVTAGDSVAVDAFMELRRFDYVSYGDLKWSNGDGPTALKTQRGIVGAVIDSALADSVIAAGGVAEPFPVVGFSILDLNSMQGFESLLGSDDAMRLFARILPALQSDSQAYSAIFEFACVYTGLPGPTSSNDVTNLMWITSRPPQVEPKSGDLLRWVIVRNASPKSLEPPLILGLTPWGLEVLNAKDRICDLSLFTLRNLGVGERDSVLVRYRELDSANDRSWESRLHIYAWGK